MLRDRKNKFGRVYWRALSGTKSFNPLSQTPQNGQTHSNKIYTFFFLWDNFVRKRPWIWPKNKSEFGTNQRCSIDIT